MDTKAINSVSVFKGDTLIGTLARSERGAIFKYLENYKGIEGLSYTMSPSRKSYEINGYNLHPFFAGLLPEGLRLKALRTLLKTSEDDLFSLLIGSGSDTIGDISLSISAEIPTVTQTHAYELAQVSFKELFQSSITSSDPDRRVNELTVAGVQPKISAGMISFPVQVKMRRRFCILKLSPEEYPQITENEFFFTEMARDCGLEVPRCMLVQDRDGVTGLLLERFDRRYNKVRKQPEKIHQEDACQFLDKYPADKYRLSFSEIAEGVNSLSSAPIIETAKLIRLKAFSYLIANGNLHAKNISLASEPGTGAVSITPAYDIVSTWPYGDRSMALKFEGRDDNIMAKDFINFGKRFGVREAATTRILSEISQQALSWIDRITEIGLSDKQTVDLKKLS